MMGQAKINRARREREGLPARPSNRATREPKTPLPGWPASHASASLTGDDEEECVRVTIHGVDHLLHATTARELSNALLATLDQYNDGVRSALSDPAVKAMLSGNGVSDLIV